jgi:quercetin dioxygenase-like cupin family protein
MRALLLLAAGAVIGGGVAFALPRPLLAQPASASQTAAPARPSSATKELFRAELPDLPGKQLVVVPLRFLPANGPKAPAHQHPGSVFVYVTKGEARLGIAGQAAQLVAAGQGFFEPVGAIHDVSESASPTETATGIAFMIVPDGAPLVKMVPAGRAGR